jgi:peptidoglycan/LPS O-acetylase OafA/YrhL
MKHNWVPYAAIIAGASLLLMTVLIFTTKDDVSDSVAVPLYLGGLLLALAAAVGTGLRMRRGRRAIVAVGLSMLVVAWAMGIGDLLTPIFEALFGDKEYVGDQGPIGLFGAVLVALGARAKVADREPRHEISREPVRA